MYANGQLETAGRVHHAAREHSSMTDRATTAASYAASAGTAGWSLLTVQEWGVVAGIMLGMATWCTNAYYKRKDDQRQAELHALDIEIKRARVEHEI